jgi:internalin A
MKRTLTRGTIIAALAAGSFVLLACEDPPKNDATPSVSAAKPKKSMVIPVTEPTAEPKAEEAKRPKKKPEDCPKGGELAIDNQELEQAIRFKLQKDKGTLTQADLGRLTSLNLSQMKVHELDVCLFPHMKNLKELFLGAGDLDDLGPIEDLTKLESLRASLNKVSNLEPLAKMTRMDRLDLGQTKVTNLGPLEGMTRLTELSLDGTPVEDLSALSGMKDLERLSIKRTQVKDVSPLKDLSKLKFIYVTDTPADQDPMSFAPLRANGTKVMND